MSLAMMYGDELRGFYKSRVMLVLWVGMPILALILHIVQPDLEGQMSLTIFATFLVSTMSSTIAAVLLSVGIIHEKARGVYALFLVRPVKRRSIVLGKFFAVFTCIAVAALLTLAVGLLYDIYKGGLPAGLLLREVGKSLVTGFATISITSAAGLLIGILSPSILAGVILVIYGANQLSVLGLVPVLLKLEPAWLYSLGIGVVFSVVLLVLSVVFFNRKQF